MIATELGADVEEVIDLKKRQGRVAYMSCGRDAMTKKETEIAETKRNPTDYDLIVLVQPVWAFSPTPAIRTYVNKNDMSGKKVALFFGGTKLRDAVEKTKTLMPNSTFAGDLAVEEPLENKEEAKNTIVEWCKTLNVE